ncbi:YdiU family protein [Alkalinema sp. FACHB-956]|uniref:protein adenylyltransferase SelO n=1 Tax=Alkalinema sp. FACHB-956 TaxID=2692768 RepID=UPI0016860D42|nr:YdiU family protein [Alkalinema sp. FACHB-956]MBD2330091.1 YdiU family protein [Alkalinema sp. FACHB-956]
MGSVPFPGRPVNPILALNYEPAIEQLGEDYFDPVPAAEFPSYSLRWRNDDVLQQLGLDPEAVTDQHFIEAFGQFQGRSPFLALRYHGYQFGEYNPALGDGRGFLYGQVRGIDDRLYDLGTKGSGTTPYSRGGDGRLTLKGGVREVLAAEMLYRLGVRTSRCLSLVETGEKLWRGDEPSPTRSSVMIRVQQSHIRFGTFERLHYLGRKDLIANLLEHGIEYYYPHLLPAPDRYARFYGELVCRVAELVAQWMAAGFCHAVLNTDNMAITGESFDYGPYAFIPSLDPKFTAAYFDYFGRYAYSNQPLICKWNLQMLQVPLKLVISESDLDAAIAQYDAHYGQTYRALMLKKLGFGQTEELGDDGLARELLKATIEFLHTSQTSYHGFFWELTRKFSPTWRQDANQILADFPIEVTDLQPLFDQWRQRYHQLLNNVPEADLPAIQAQLYAQNPDLVITRPEIEAVWEPITQDDNWQPFNTLLQRIRTVLSPQSF